MIQGYDILEIKPPTALRPFFDERAAKLWSLGEQAILNRRLLGIISARQIDADLALKSSVILKQLSTLNEVAFIGGWHSPLEEEGLRILLSQGASIVFCVSKSLNRFIPSAELKTQVSSGNALLLTHCSPKAGRISRDASVRRNQLVIALARALLVLSAPTGSSSLNLAKSALREGKPVFTQKHRMNGDLLACNALPASFNSIRAALR